MLSTNHLEDFQCLIFWVAIVGPVVHAIVVVFLCDNSVSQLSVTVSCAVDSPNSPSYMPGILSEHTSDRHRLLGSAR